jgi:hypothetical protein
MPELEIGMFGEASFKYEKKGFKGGITAFGKIIDLDKKLVWFQDNDGYEYLVRRDKFNFKEDEE